MDQEVSKRIWYNLSIRCGFSLTACSKNAVDITEILVCLHEREYEGKRFFLIIAVRRWFACN